MKDDVYELITKTMSWAHKLGVRPRDVKVKRLRDKWGTCDARGVITLSDDLIYRDEHFQDFVIVHELLHLKFMNHGRVFKALLSIHIPDWKTMDTRKIPLPKSQPKSKTRRE